MATGLLDNWTPGLETTCIEVQLSIRPTVQKTNWSSRQLVFCKTGLFDSWSLWQLVFWTIGFLDLDNWSWPVFKRPVVFLSKKPTIEHCGKMYSKIEISRFFNPTIKYQFMMWKWLAIEFPELHNVFLSTKWRWKQMRFPFKLHFIVEMDCLLLWRFSDFQICYFRLLLQIEYSE